jgi:hypothetical protein
VRVSGSDKIPNQTPKHTLAAAPL